MSASMIAGKRVAKLLVSREVALAVTEAKTGDPQKCPLKHHAYRSNYAPHRPQR